MVKQETYTRKEVIELLEFLRNNYHLGGIAKPQGKKKVTPYFKVTHEDVLENFCRSKESKLVKKVGQKVAS